jgi:uncharacterized metal-binding protein
MESSNVCAGGDTLIFACSGAADVGEVADRAARKMTKQGIGKMFCLAGIGGQIEPILKKTAAATKILAIDGCSLNCVKSSLEQAGFTQFEHLQLGDIGMAKGQTSATPENIDKAVQAVKRS